MTNDICPTCGQAMNGVAFVDYRNPDGDTWGRMEAYCVPCEQAKYPFPRLEAERTARVAKRMTHREAATALGITAPLLSQYEAGMHEVPNDVLAAMRRLYGMDDDHDAYGYGDN